MAQKVNSIKPFPKDIMENYRWVDEYLLKQPATEKEFKTAWQAYRYLLMGKMYAYIGVNDQNCRPIITLKLDPLYSDILRREYENIVPGYYMNKINWSTVYLDSDVPREVLVDVMSSSHKWVLSSLSMKAQRDILGKPAS